MKGTFVDREMRVTFVFGITTTVGGPSPGKVPVGDAFQKTETEHFLFRASRCA